MKFLPILTIDVKRQGKIDLTETHLDGSFSSAKKGGTGIGKTKRGNGSKIMAITDGNGLPVAISTSKANTHEIKLIEKQ